MAKVVFQSVTKVFPGAVCAVDDLTLAVEDQELLVVVGPSGCGKSTLLRLLAGLEDATAGSILLDDQVVNDWSPRDRDLAMVFQNYALYPHMSVRDNMAFGLKRRGLARDEVDRRVRSAAEQLGLEGLLKRKPRALSGGERQRVALARAIVRAPRAYLFDEPLSNLDAVLRVETRVRIKELQRASGTTSLYVTHDQEEAMTLGDRIAVMKDGRLRQVGKPLEIYHQPADRFVAGFVGSPAMNFLLGRLAGQGDELRFRSDGVDWPMRTPLNEAAAQRTDADVLLGVRPEAIALREPGDSAISEAALPVGVSLVETLGDRMDVHVISAGGARWIARVPVSSQVSEGQSMMAVLDLDRIHLFEPGLDGRRLSASGPGSARNAG